MLIAKTETLIYIYFTGHRISNDAYTCISSVHTVLDSEKERRRKCSG